jgi:hypothetical protein
MEERRRMWTSLALAAALGASLAQSGQLTISNVRPTYGVLGPQRPDDRVIPGDIYFLAFDVEGFKVADDGKVSYTMAMEITDHKGSIVHGRDPRDLVTYNSLGTGKIQAIAHADAPLDQPAGEYTIKVTVSDRTAKASQSLTRKFEVAKKTFGLVRVGITSDPDGRLAAPPLGVVGQSIYLNCHAVNFSRDPGKGKQPNVTLEMIIKDSDGNPTLAKPAAGSYNRDIGEEIVALPMSFALVLNRSGKFTVDLVATDRITKEKAATSFPITVVEQKAQ